MGILKGRNNAGQWVNASVVYGWNSSGVKTYAKAMFMRKADNSGWERAWTDCRQHDAAGGRDWNPPTSSAVTVTCANCNGCGTSEKVVTTLTYTKTGCPTYTRTSETACTSCGVWSPSVGTFTENGVEYSYDGPAGYYSVFGIGNPSVPGCATCYSGCYNTASYYIENCSVGGRRGTTTPTYCLGCYDVFWNPCF